MSISAVVMNAGADLTPFPLGLQVLKSALLLLAQLNKNPATLVLLMTPRSLIYLATSDSTHSPTSESHIFPLWKCQMY